MVLSSQDSQAENRAWHYLAGHLANLGLPVARLMAADADKGLFLMQDLGRASLQQAALDRKDDSAALAGLYTPALEMLARLQAQGSADFDASICFDGAALSPDFLLRREAGYFLEQFVCGACGLGQGRLPRGLAEDLAQICDLAGKAGPRGLVHRDFQSRNILVRKSGLGLVDFQGARLGPAQYDLAALVNDPYVDLPWDLRQRLMDEYLQHRAALGEFDTVSFEKGWPFVALCRIMQTLGAFSFLTRVRGRRHFAPYAAPALATLRTLCQDPALGGFSAFKSLVSMLPAKDEVTDLFADTQPENK